MAPIEGLSDIVRMPRLGHVRLGIKVEKPGKSPYPQATDYFVCPPEIQRVFGEKPAELEIMFPVESPEVFAQQWLRAYSLTQGLVCIGDGATSRSKVDLATGEISTHETRDWEWREGLPCNPQECPEYQKKRCRRVMNLQFLLPKVEGLGVWQIDTTSFYSIVNINSMIKLVKNLCGHISFIPLTLCLGPIEITPPGMTKKTVHVMHIKQEVKLVELLQAAQKGPARLIMPDPDVEGPPEDLFPPVVLEESLAKEPPPVQQPSPEFKRATVKEPPPVQQPSPELELVWKRVRELQKGLGLPDDVIKSAIRMDHPDLKKVVKGNLPDTSPPWLTLELAKSLRERLEKSLKTRQGPVQPAQATQDTTVPASAPENEKAGPCHPWPQMKETGGIDDAVVPPTPAEQVEGATAAFEEMQGGGGEEKPEPEMDI